MSILSRLFGGGRAPANPPETYKDFTITPDPVREGSVFRIAATIEKPVGDRTRTHRLIRADTVPSMDEAVAVSIRKAKQVIDEQGDAIFRD